MNDRTRDEARRAGAMAALAIVLLTASRAPAAAQGTPDGASWFPRRFVTAPLRAAPREVRMRGGFLSADRSPEDFAGRNIEALVSLGFRLPVVRLRSETNGGPAVDLGFEVGSKSRFFMETSEKDLITVDYRVGFPLSLRRGALDVRLTAFHESAHVGDDFVRRFEPQVRQVSREALGLLIGWRPLAGGRVYGRGEWNFGRSSSFEESGIAGRPVQEVRTVGSWRVGGGVEYDPTWDTGSGAGPIVAVDFESEDRVRRLATTAMGGASVWVRTVRLLFTVEVHDGPSAMGQLHDSDETYWGLNLTIDFWAGRGG